ncbi:hypothetical protein PR048_004343 [Dryococelus australis]|uniref:Uncharacterized protein n=1 Tax=Dryococelus australis TaxID=614101 RepID=A0ABQ9I674_9NEOP|nr:hypothetical protein PR048_004343 [Dryococelus australis]
MQWEGQAVNKLECPWRSNSRGVAFQTMPRRYVIMFQPKFLPQLKAVDNLLVRLHELNDNDPLNDLPSHLQIRKGKGLLYMNMTNISSHLIRQKLAETYLGLLTRSVKSLHIQIINDQNQWLRLRVDNTTQLLQYLLLPLNKIPPEANMGMEDVPPWKETTSEFWENIRPSHEHPEMNPPTHATTGIQTEQHTRSSSGAQKRSTSNSEQGQPQQKKPQP